MAALASILGAIRQRESGGNYGLTPEQNYAFPNSHASGAYQIQPGTWREWTQQSGIGTEYSQAYQAPPAVQDQVAGWAVQKYGPNETSTWAASAPSGGYPTLGPGDNTDLGGSSGGAGASGSSGGTLSFNSIYGSAYAGSGMDTSGAFNLSGGNFAGAGAGQPVGPDNPGSIGGMVGTDQTTGNTGPGGPGTGLAAALGNNVSPGAIPANAMDTGAGLPIVITDVTSAGYKGAKLQSDTAKANTSAQISAGTGWLGSFEKAGTDWLVRGGLILLAVILLAGAWVFYSTDKGGVHVEVA